VISNSKSVSSSLVSEGYPSDWNNNIVKRIGLTNNDQRIDKRKIIEFMKINYNESKKLLGTVYDYVLFFVNESEDVQNIEGFCGTGNPEVNITYDIISAYYHKDEVKLKQFMIDTFDADVYNPSGPDIDDLIDNINNYGFIVIESPELNTATFNDVKAAIEPYVDSGGIFMLSGRPLSAQGGEMLGVKFYKVTGDAGKNKPATVIKEDESIAFEYGEQIIFNQVYYIEDVSIGSDLTVIARFNESDIEIEDIMDNKIALARWPYGEGRTIFFSDFDATYLAGDFQEVLEASTKRWIGAACLPINMSNININNLAKTNRFLTYNKAGKSNIIKMVLYLWS